MTPEQAINPSSIKARNAASSSGIMYPPETPGRSPSVPTPELALLADRSIRELEHRLERHINPERSRRFRPADWEKSLGLLEEITRDERLSPDGLRIAIVGSNGKGSTAFYLAALLEALIADATERPIGLYTSPHLLTVNERIRLNLHPCSGSLLLEHHDRLLDILGPTAKAFSYFEILTLLSLGVFRSFRSPVQIYEAGLGGRLDATRTARASVVIMTPITVEHAKILGDEPERILREKAGIITDTARLVLVMPQPLLSLETVTRSVRELNSSADIHFYKSDHSPEGIPYTDFNQAFARFALEKITAHPLGRRLPSTRLAPPTTPGMSATPGISATPTASAIRQYPGIQFQPQLPGRMERRIVEAGRTGRRVVLIFDTAHNDSALTIALDALRLQPDFPGFGRCAIVIGMLPDRPLVGALELAARREPGILLQLVAENLHPPVAGFSPAEAGRLGPLLENLIAEKDPGFILLTGSHRIYQYFLALEEFFGKSARTGKQ